MAKGKPSDTSGEGTELKEMVGTDVHVRHPNRNLKTWKEKTFSQDGTSTTPQEIYGVLTKDMLKELATFRAECCITLILPTHRAGMEVNENQDAILFKNLLQDVKKDLEEKNIEPAKIEKMLSPAFELLHNDPFWRNQGEGLALFIAEDFFRYIKLPFQVRQECIVNNTFYLINLLRLLNTTAGDEFYLLLIRRDKTKLYKADTSGVHEVTPGDMPANINSVVNFEEDGKEYMKTEAGDNTGTPEHINAGRPEKVIIGNYIEKINKVFQQLAPQDAAWPLLLAGQQELLDIFRNTTQYNNVMDTELIVSDEHADSKKLYTQARQKIDERMDRERDERLETYLNNIATNLTSSMPDKVIPASFYSQVRVLFVEKGAHCWGSFDEQHNQLDIHATRETGDDCLVEKAAVQTILHGGEVFILEKEKMPKGAMLAALMRF